MWKLLRLATRNVLRNKRRTALALSALVIGVTVMVAMRGFLNGLRVSMVESTIQGSLGALQVHKQGYLANVQALPLTFDMADSPELRRRIEAVPGVIAVAPRITFGAMAAVPPVLTPGKTLDPEDLGRTAYFSATAIDPALEQRVTPKRWESITHGRMLASSDAEEMLLNQDFNRGLRAPLTPQTTHLPEAQTWPALLAGDRDGALNGANVRLTGTFALPMPGDKRTGLVGLGTAQKVLRMEGRVTEYAIAVRDAMNDDELQHVKGGVQRALGPGYEVSTWDELVPLIRTGMKTQDFVFNTLTGIFLLVALLGVVNTMLMSVLERTREIGTMMAVGTRRMQIVVLFVFEGCVSGIAGGLGGAAIGTAATLWMGHVGITFSVGGAVPWHIWPFLAPSSVAAAVALAAAISSLAALYPALRASRLRPVEALATP